LKNHNPYLSSDHNEKEHNPMFPTLFIHTTLIYHYVVTFVKVIQSENFPKGSCQSKESQPQRLFSLQNAFSKEMGVHVRKKNLVKRFDLKISF
jgi:hypothetical protein